MRTTRILCLGVTLTMFVGCSSSTTADDESDDDAGTVDAGPVSVLPALPGYTVSVWARGVRDGGSGDYYNPDSIDSDGTHIFVGYQNTTPKVGNPDGGSNIGFGGTSTIVEYSADGTQVIKTFSVPGHCDGMRLDPTGKLWASSNEDGFPNLESIDTTTGTATNYTIIPYPPVHGGGFDDIYFIAGKMFIVGSNPTPDATGAISVPVLYTVAIDGGTPPTATMTPVLMGNQDNVPDLAGGTVTLSEVDPDSLSKDFNGDLVLINQGGTEILFIADAGTLTSGSPAGLSRIATGTQFDDTVWVPSSATANSKLLVADATKNTIFAVQGPLAGKIFTEAPNDSSIIGFLGVVDLTQAQALGYAVTTPVVIGFGKPTGLYYVP